jgi:hypothetical protein
MVILYRSFNDRAKYDPRRQVWHPSKATGGYSSSEQAFVVVGPGVGDRTSLAHEIGHYLHLSHTFRGSPKSIAAAADMIRNYVERGRHSRAEGLNVFDGDLPAIRDTPPDPDKPLFAAAGLDPCGPIDAVDIPVMFRDGTTLFYRARPDRHNLMSYFKGCRFDHDFSPQQIARMRNALLNGNRRQVAYVP